MTTFSVNVNKIAVLRNSRGGTQPSVIEACRLAIAAGADGITVHPREDQRHILLDDCVEIAGLPEIESGAVEFNIEGDLRPELLRMTKTLRPTQFTVVAVMPGEVTSTRGWRAYDDHDELQRWCADLKDVCRVAVFADPDERSVALAHTCGADGVEFYTGSYARAFGTPAQTRELDRLVTAAGHARDRGMRVHAGHDLTKENLVPLFAAMAVDEVSIGHVIAAEGIFSGYAHAIKQLRAVIPPDNPPGKPPGKPVK